MEYCRCCKYVIKDELVCDNCVCGNRFKKGETMNEISFEMLKEKGARKSLLVWFKYNAGALTCDLPWLINAIKQDIVLDRCDCDKEAMLSWLKENFEEKRVHKIGNRYRMGYAEYILCATGISKVTLVDLKDGRYWHINTEVRNPFAIAEYEFKTICDGSEFKLISEGSVE